MKVTYLAKFSVHFQDFIGYLGASHHGALFDLPQDGATQKHQFFDFFVDYAWGGLLGLIRAIL